MVQLANLILSEYANYVMKNLFKRNKQVKSKRFLVQIEASLNLI